MSNYSSAETLWHLWGGPYRIDVADSCMGEDVRILLDGRSAYLSTDDARLVTAALIEKADVTDAWAAYWRGEGDVEPNVIPEATPVRGSETA